MKTAPSYFEWAEGVTFYSPLYAEFRDRKDPFEFYDFEFTDAGVEVEHTDIAALTPTERAAYDRAFK